MSIPSCVVSLEKNTPKGEARNAPTIPTMRTRTKTGDAAASAAPNQDNTADAIRAAVCPACASSLPALRAACTVACTVCRANWRAACFCEAPLDASAISCPLLKNAEERCAPSRTVLFCRIAPGLSVSDRREATSCARFKISRFREIFSVFCLSSLACAVRASVPCAFFRRCTACLNTARPASAAVSPPRSAARSTCSSAARSGAFSCVSRCRESRFSISSARSICFAACCKTSAFSFTRGPPALFFVFSSFIRLHLPRSCAHQFVKLRVL